MGLQPIRVGNLVRAGDNVKTQFKFIHMVLVDDQEKDRGWIEGVPHAND